jgi:cytochrome b561
MTVQPAGTGIQRYDAITIILHWLVAVLVAALWIGAETLDWFPQGPVRADARSLHILLGLLLGGIGAIRLVWRLSFGQSLPPVEGGALGYASKVVHHGVYVLLAAMVFVGMLLLSATGDSAFNHVSIAANDSTNAALAAQLQHVHAVIGWMILAVIGLHIMGVLLHHYVLHDGVLERMLLRR